MAKKIDTKKEEKEREYIIPLRDKCRVVPRYRKTPKAVKTVKEFLVKHMKIYDRDLNKIKIDKYLNEFLWFRGIKRPPHKIKVKAQKDANGIVKVELAELPTKLKFKKERKEKLDKTSKEIAESKKKKTLMEKAQGVGAEKQNSEKSSDLTPEQENLGTQEKAEEIERKKEEKEKKSAVVEAGRELEKAASKQVKKMKNPQAKQPKRQQRKVLNK